MELKVLSPLVMVVVDRSSITRPLSGSVSSECFTNSFPDKSPTQPNRVKIFR